MAKRRKKGDSLYAYFQGLFEENPAWLDAPRNVDILARYRADHGLADDAPIKDTIRNALANKKSLMKKARDEGTNGKPKPKHKGKNGRRKGHKVVAAVLVTAGPRPSAMRSLEEQIDDCLAVALTLDRSGLVGVIKSLRHARDEVVLRIGGSNGN